MKIPSKLPLLLVGSMLFFSLNAQNTLSNFDERSDTFIYLDDLEAKFLDLQQDERMDLVYSGTSAIGDPTTLIYLQGETGFDAAFMTIPLKASDIAFADLTSDGFGELILYGENDSGGFELLIFKGDSLLAMEPILFGQTVPEDADLLVIDLDNDGQKEIIFNGTTLSIFTMGESGYELQQELDGTTSGDLVYLDYDNDSWNDLIVTGRNDQNELVSLLYRNDSEGGFSLVESGLPGLYDGNLSIGDLDHDGFMDLIMTGMDELDEPKADVYLFSTEEDIFKASSSLPGVHGGSALVAEITGDGRTDIFYSGYNSLGQPRSYAYTFNSLMEPSEEAEDTLSYYSAFGDINADGQLDMLNSTLTEIKLFNNNLPLNTGPLVATLFPPVTDGERTIFTWQSGVDDLTASETITYDFFIKDAEDSFYVSPANSLIRQRYRYVSEHGYLLNDTTFVYEGVINGRVDFGVWGVDNVLNAGGVCRGVLWQGNTVDACVEVIPDSTNACPGQQLTLDFGANDVVEWYNFAGETISNQDVLNYTAQRSETIYAIAIRGNCLINYWIRITVEEPAIPDRNFTICTNEVFEYSLDPAVWSTATWTSRNQGLVSSSLDVSYTVTRADTLIVDATSISGCSVTDSLFIDVAPAFETSVTQPSGIFIGESISLQASGGVSYAWTPATGLTNPESATTQARPTRTTTYTVEITSAEGCVQFETVTVEVQNSVFVPELFTPNSDGNNDVLKVYGTDVGSIRFTVMDREGNKLYETSDPQNILGRGWDGIAAGREVPNGTYVWTLEGRFNDGSPVSMKGKNSGSIKLVR